MYLCDWLQKNCYEKRLYVEYILLHVQVYETLYTLGVIGVAEYATKQRRANRK